MPDELTEVESADQIVITLHEEQDQGVFLRSVDLFVSEMKIRFSARATSVLEDVFQSDLAKLIREICGSSTMAKQIVNVPDFRLRIRGLAIDGYTLLVHTLDNGMRQFILRLKKATGNALALFKNTDRAGEGLALFSAGIAGGNGNQVGTERLFDEMLSHIYLPLVNLNTYLKNVLDGERPGNANQLGSSVVQLKTKAEVLQFAFDRLISEMMLDRFTEPKLETAQAKAIEQRVN